MPATPEIAFNPLAESFRIFLGLQLSYGEGKCLVSRFPWLFRRPRILIAAFLPFAIAHTVFTIQCWVRAGKVEPLLLSPFLLLGRLAYACGLAIGGIQNLSKEKTSKVLIGHKS